MQKNHENVARPMSSVIPMLHQKMPPSLRLITPLERDPPPLGVFINWIRGSMLVCWSKVAGTRMRKKCQVALVALVQSWPSGTAGAGSMPPGAVGSKEVPHPQLRAAFGFCILNPLSLSAWT